ncbi:hypothetical protein KQI69_05010 [Eubacterium sp. MSJ-13]|uniref:hypothetical protein n=1 Tax=Eubacterium sp. MSJ-13 TaxID=2841513 RepID=UPI001C10FA96|nr:hypothetical protein [Eubacterium sp. MSJ-13]MBU5478559.1 hypothetical protein [Eubacterium sp. MSJ-13]
MSDFELTDERLQKKRDIVKRGIDSCARYSTDRVYFYGNLTDKAFFAAKQSYAGKVNREMVLGMIDNTITGSAKNGLLLAVDGIYYKRMLESPGYISYADAAENEKLLKMKLGDDFMINNLNKMVKEIHAVDNLTLNEFLEKANEKVINIDKTIDSVNEVFTTAQGLFNKWFK